jgi:Uma2 family endonuclease
MATVFPTNVHLQEPAWQIALLFPPQGQWTPSDYFALTHSTNRLVEFNEGNIEVLEMPTESHQFIVRFLFRALDAFVVSRDLGEVVFAPIRVQTLVDKFREPDLAFMLSKNAGRRNNRFWIGADIVMEVISDDPESRDRDLRQKREEYAAAKIPEYWMIDALSKQITVLRLDTGRYVEHGVFGIGQEATSILLSGFGADVTSVFRAAENA